MSCVPVSVKLAENAASVEMSKRRRRWDSKILGNLFYNDDEMYQYLVWQSLVRKTRLDVMNKQRRGACEVFQISSRFWGLKQFPSEPSPC